MKSIFLLFALVYFTNASMAQWSHEGPEYDGPEILLRDDSLLFASCQGYLFYSSNDGNDWEFVWPAPPIYFVDLIKVGGTIIAHTQIGIMRSFDGGFNWVESNQGIITPNSYLHNTMISFPNGRILLAMSSSGLYESLDTAQTWQQIFPAINEANMLAIDTANGIIACTTDSGVYSSTDYGVNWVQSNSGISSLNLARIYFQDGVWFCTNTANAIYHSQGNTFNWVQSNGVTGVYYSPPLLQMNGRIFANRNNGVREFDFASNQFVLSDLNQTHSMVLTGGIENKFWGFRIYNNRIERAPSYYSVNYGQNWEITHGIKCNYGFGFTEGNSLITKGPFGFEFETTTDSFLRIMQPGAILAANIIFQNGIKKGNGIIYAATDNGVCTSNDNGQTWVQHLTGLPTGGTIPSYKYVYDIELNGDTVIAATGQGPFISTDGANTFFAANVPWAQNTKDFLWHNGKLYAAGNPGILVSNDGGGNWMQFGSSGGNYRLIAAAGPYIYTASATSIYMTIDTIGITTNIIGNLTGMIGNTEPAIAAYDTLLFVSNESAVGIRKMNVNNVGVYVPIFGNLPSTPLSGGGSYFGYLYGHNYLAVFNGKLWLSTPSLSCFTRPLSDFGYPPVVVSDQKKEPKMAVDKVLVIYPNPVSEELNLLINCKDENPLLIQINNITGELVYQQSSMVSSGVLKINLASLNSGLYLVKLSDTNGNMKAVKFVKQ
jgi:hypothetical protein